MPHKTVVGEVVAGSNDGDFEVLVNKQVVKTVHPNKPTILLSPYYSYRVRIKPIVNTFFDYNSAP